MRNLRTPEELINRISLYDLHVYFQKNNWGFKRSNDKKLICYYLTSNPSISLILPGEEHYSDTKKRIAQAINAISQIEERPIETIISDLINQSSDSLLIKLKTPNNTPSLPLTDIHRHIKAIQNLIIYGACAELDPRPYYEQAPKAAEALASSFQFCHTYNGSFGFEIAAPISQTAKNNDFFEPPSQRKVIERIARGVILLKKATTENNPGILTEAYGTALNSRMCDAISEIGLDAKLNFNIDIEWANTLPPSEDVKDYNSAEITAAHIEILHVASKRLKTVAPELDLIEGRVINLGEFKK